ncbi:VOC family protein [Rhodococcus fascians]|nr:VOC family protein [Rhodococcus fascians]
MRTVARVQQAAERVPCRHRKAQYEVVNVTPTQLRAQFALRLSALYGREVPAYTTLLDVTASINADTMRTSGADAERFGSIDRVTAERHGAIRVGNAREISQVALIFGAMGMYPVGFYDLRDTASSSIPVVSTAFRPIDPAELAINPFRIFTSMLVASDRRFFDADLGARLTEFLNRRTLFPPLLLQLADRCEHNGGLKTQEASTFLDLATAAFALSTEPVDRAWYRELDAVSAVAADIGGVTSTHINHLTPRVLDIDLLHRRMGEHGVTMIDTIQGPPRTSGPGLLLRQTSFRALDEQRMFVDENGKVEPGHLRVRFGEVEARGVAATASGRTRYDTFLDLSDPEPPDDASALWTSLVPDDESVWLAEDLAYFSFRLTGANPAAADRTGGLIDLIESGVVAADPIVYEDFLPKSAAGIFRSNLESDGSRHSDTTAAAFDAEAMEGVLERDLHDPYRIYGRIREESVTQIENDLGLSEPLACPWPR